MRGTVQLENGHSPEGVYVWMEGADLQAFTDEDGSFRLNWPAGFDEISGIFKVYFFVANYRLDSVEVAMVNGEFLYGERGLNSTGELKGVVRLRHFLAVSSDVAPQTVTLVNNLHVTMTFSLRLQTFGDVASVVLPNTTPGFLSSVFFRNIETGELFVFQGQPVTTDEEVLVGPTPVIRKMNVDYTRINLPAGNYRVIPYILVQRNDLPKDVINSIALNVLAFGPNYLKLPLKRDGGMFEIKE